MKSNDKGSSLGWLMVALLSAAGVYGIWFLPNQAAADPMANFTEETLRQRFEEYASLRMQEDWIKVYEYVDPEERNQITLAKFISIYGHGIMRTLELTAGDVTLHEETRSASVRMAMNAELVVERLPAQFKKGFRMPEDPNDLRKAGEDNMSWVLRDNQWYYRLDDQMLRGNEGSVKTANAF